MPCFHTMVVLDKNDQRVSAAQMIQFRKDYVAPYFWSENYIAGYKGLFVESPSMNQTKNLRLKPGARLITRPVMPRRQQKKRGNKTRKDKTVFLKRTRAIWDEAGYRKRARMESGSSGPRNPFVRITNPNIFNRQPCGRKGIPREEIERHAKSVFEYIEESSHVTTVPACAPAMGSPIPVVPAGINMGFISHVFLMSVSTPIVTQPLPY